MLFHTYLYRFDPNDVDAQEIKQQSISNMLHISTAIYI